MQQSTRMNALDISKTMCKSQKKKINEKSKL